MELIRCIFESLALKYKNVLDKFRSLAPFPIERLHIIGGGAKKPLLNQFTANSTGVTVVAGPSEGTAIGNIMLQAPCRRLRQLSPRDARHDQRRHRDRNLHSGRYRCMERCIRPDQIVD